MQDVFDQYQKYLTYLFLVQRFSILHFILCSMALPYIAKCCNVSDEVKEVEKVIFLYTKKIC